MTALYGFLAVLAGGTGYYFSCRWWPFGPCFRCVGHPGKNRGSNKRRWGTCRRCGGSGKRTRWGARLITRTKGS